MTDAEMKARIDRLEKKIDDLILVNARQDRTYTRAQLLSAANISRYTLHQLMNEGYLEDADFSVGRGKLYTPQDLEILKAGIQARINDKRA